MTFVKSNIEFYRARMFEFADFLDNLPEHKFNHKKWCKPDHTCRRKIHEY